MIGLSAPAGVGRVGVGAGRVRAEGALEGLAASLRRSGFTVSSRIRSHRLTSSFSCGEMLHPGPRHKGLREKSETARESGTRPHRDGFSRTSAGEFRNGL